MCCLLQDVQEEGLSVRTLAAGAHVQDVEVPPVSEGVQAQGQTPLPPPQQCAWPR